jgi:hypothetical protein
MARWPRDVAAYAYAAILFNRWQYKFKYACGNDFDRAVKKLFEFLKKMFYDAFVGPVNQLVRAERL